MYVADATSHRITYYDMTNGTFAGFVYGKLSNTDFTDGSANTGGVSSRSLNQPAHMAIDSNDRLYVCDSGNNRVLVFSSKNPIATFVYGQANFSSNPVNRGGGTQANSLNRPIGIAVSAPDNVIYIGDTNNHRVLKWAIGASSATVALGQSSLTAATCGCGSGLCQPMGLALDVSGNLYGAQFSLFFSASCCCLDLFAQWLMQETIAWSDFLQA